MKSITKPFRVQLRQFRG